MAGRVYYGTMRAEAVATVPVEPLAAEGYIVFDPDRDPSWWSWWPKDEFEATYRPADRMGFEGALAAMREGRKVRRCTIDAAHVSIWLDGDTFWAQREGSYAGHWHPNVASLLADWMVVE